eukprot:3092674-Prorocentrum_lima.AAC.1
MTSSLVGSEMCIRDRSRRAPVPARSNKPSMSKHLLFVLVANMRVSYLESVSYTHLTLPTICSV